MIINNITDIDGFFGIVEKCKGRVEIVTSEGDRLNLKSKLCQYISLAKVFQGDKGFDAQLVCYEAEDVRMFVDWMMNKK